MRLRFVYAFEKNSFLFLNDQFSGRPPTAEKNWFRAGMDVRKYASLTVQLCKPSLQALLEEFSVASASGAGSSKVRKRVEQLLRMAVVPGKMQDDSVKGSRWHNLRDLI